MTDNASGWTTTLPERSGYYWWRPGHRRHTEIVEIRMSDDLPLFRAGPREPMCWADEDGQWVTVEPYGYRGGEWQGPLEPPR